MGIISSIASAILPGAFKVIDQAVTDKDLAMELKNKLQMAALQGELVSMETARDIIVAEAKGESPLQRNWRPITMMVFVAIIANNYILVPYAAAFGFPVPALEIPPDMWGLLTVGIGGYIASRGVEKGLKTWKEKD